LLLKDLFRHTASDHPDHSLLAKALEKIEASATFINEEQRIAENNAYVQGIQEILTPPMVRNKTSSIVLTLTNFHLERT
jgi:hypothetical protein